jgi:hypothetical protein
MRNIGDFIHDTGIGVLITHCPGGRLSAWPLRVVAEDRAAWWEGASKDGAKLPLDSRFTVDPEPALVRQVKDCPRVSVIFQDGQRYCFLSGLARMANDQAPMLQMEILTAEFRELAMELPVELAGAKDVGAVS